MEEGQELKQSLLAHARAEIEVLLSTTEASLGRLEESLANETKSSAGDKFETGRAMLHLEQQKLSKQVATALERLEAVARIQGRRPTELISEGSLVATNRGLYFVGLGLGKVRMSGRTVFCTTLESPIGSALIGKQIGEMFVFNELEFLILGVV